jgi:hypothetical protein
MMGIGAVPLRSRVQGGCAPAACRTVRQRELRHEPRQRRRIHLLVGAGGASRAGARDPLRRHIAHHRRRAVLARRRLGSTGLLGRDFAVPERPKLAVGAAQEFARAHCPRKCHVVEVVHVVHHPERLPCAPRTAVRHRQRRLPLVSRRSTRQARTLRCGDQLAGRCGAATSRCCRADKQRQRRRGGSPMPACESAQPCPLAAAARCTGGRAGLLGCCSATPPLPSPPLSWKQPPQPSGAELLPVRGSLVVG